MKKINTLLDIILCELYNNNTGNWILLQSIVKDLDYQSLLNLSSILNDKGYVITSYGGGIIKLVLTIDGKRFCETSSYSQPDVPIIKQQ